MRLCTLRLIDPTTKFVCGVGGVPNKHTSLQYQSKQMVIVRATSHTQDWEPVINTLQALFLVKKAEPVQVRFTLCSRDQRSKWLQDGCEVYIDSYKASNGSCFIVTWIIFKNRLLEVGLTQNHDTMALQTFTTVGLFYFIVREDPCE